MHDFQEQSQVHGQQCQVDRCENAFVVIFFKTMYNKTIIRFGFVMSGIIKVSVSIISLSLRLRLITLTSTLIISDITKTSSNNCLKSRNVLASRFAKCQRNLERDFQTLSCQSTYHDTLKHDRKRVKFARQGVSHVIF